MMKFSKPTFYLFLLLLLSSSTIDAQKAVDLLDILKKKIPNATFKELEAKDHFTAAYEIMLTQPLDHNNPNAGSFQQRIYLSHSDVKRPMVIETEGYTGRYQTNEISKIVQGNLLDVEYRYMGKSKPEKTDWKYLTNDQAIEDLHRIKKLFGKIYKKKWVSTGISKGGTTALIYKSKYPKDVCVAVPYVAPLALAQEDKRTDEHLLTVGSDDCRKKLSDFQRNALEKREDLIYMLDTFSVNHDLGFTKIGTAAAVEYAILEFTFSFWQWGGKCEEIPNANADSQAYFDYINAIVSFDFYSDGSYDYFSPSFYQFLTELGYYGFLKDHVKDLLVTVPNPTNLTFGPKGVDLSYTPYLQKVADYAVHKGKRILYIYGELDTWTACGVEPSPKLDALRMVKKGGAHSTRIIHFSKQEQQLIYDKLAKWLKVDIVPLEK